MYTITQKFLSPNKYSRPQTPLKQITKIALHYVGDAGASALAIHNYFEKLKNGLTYVSKGQTLYRYASSHYIIGLEGEVIQNLPESEISYCTNAANVYSLSIEVCHPDWSGKYTEKTYNTMVELCVDLCQKHGLNPLTDLIRHYDITSKICPKWFVDNPNEWQIFKQKVNDKLNGKQGDDIIMEKVFICKKIVTASTLNVREKPNSEASTKVLGQFKANDIVTVTGQANDRWYRCLYGDVDGYIHGDFVKDYEEPIQTDYKTECEKLKKVNKELSLKINDAIKALN